LRSNPAILEPIQRFHPLKAGLLFLTAALISLSIPFAGHASLYLLATLMFLCFLVPAWYTWQQGRFDAFETVNALGLLHFVYFGLAAVWTAADPSGLAYDVYLVPYLPQAALYALLGYLALLAGYFGPWHRPGALPDAEEMPRGVMFVLLPGVLGLIGGLAESVLTQRFWLGVSVRGLVSPLAQLGPLFLFGWAMVWMLVFSGRATRGQRWLLAFFLPAMAVIVLLSLTDKSLAMTLVGVPVIALWYARRKLPWRSLLVLLLVLVFVVFPFYNTFRSLDPYLPAVTRAEMTYEIIRHWDLHQYVDASIGTVKMRLALINSVAVVIRDVGRWVPYAKGKTLFMPTLAFFIPRVIWPEKPVWRMGRDFGETFRVVHILDQRTNIAVTVPGELYWNFDLPGILIGMALWGLALRWLYRRYGEAAGLDPVRRAVHIVLLVQFVHFGGGLATMLVSVTRIIVALEIYRWIGRRMGMVRLDPVKGVERS
jgi:hypothetical protein